MDVLFEICVVILSGGLGLVLFRLLKPKSVSTENQAVIVKIEDKSKQNDQIAAEIAKSLEAAQDKIKALEEEKKKDITKESLDDFFNNRKH